MIYCPAMYGCGLSAGPAIIACLKPKKRLEGAAHLLSERCANSDDAKTEVNQSRHAGWTAEYRFCLRGKQATIVGLSGVSVVPREHRPSLHVRTSLRDVRALWVYVGKRSDV